MVGTGDEEWVAHILGMEKERRRRLQSVVAVADASPYIGVVATAGRMALFPGVVTAWT
jgi:hypothetical protein